MAFQAHQGTAVAGRPVSLYSEERHIQQETGCEHLFAWSGCHWVPQKLGGR